MTIIHATDARIEISKDGEHWTSLPSALVQATALSFSPWAQAQASTLAQVEEARERTRMMGMGIDQYLHSLIGTVTRFNRGLFDALGGGHTRHAMRHRKLARYRQQLRT